MYTKSKSARIFHIVGEDGKTVCGKVIGKNWKMYKDTYGKICEECKEAPSKPIETSYMNTWS